MRLDEVLLYVWAGAEILIVAILAAYALINLAHPGDLPLAKTACARFLIWAGFVFMFLPILMVYLDVIACSGIKDSWDLIEGGILKAKELGVDFDKSDFTDDIAAVNEVFQVQKIWWLAIVLC
jgi:hypothetical protein